MNKAAKIAAVLLVVVFLGAQAIRPPKTNPPTDAARGIAAATTMKPEVARLLDRACNDCHSNQTRWPWYSNVAPTMWLVRGDVNHARTHLNFDEWGKYDPQQQKNLLINMCKLASIGEMPMPIYLHMHADASLTQADRKLLCDWTEEQRGGF